MRKNNGKVYPCILYLLDELRGFLFLVQMYIFAHNLLCKNGIESYTIFVCLQSPLTCSFIFHWNLARESFLTLFFLLWYDIILKICYPIKFVHHMKIILMKWYISNGWSFFIYVVRSWVWIIICAIKKNENNIITS